MGKVSVSPMTVRPEDLDAIERGAAAIGKPLRGNQWILVWQLLKQRTSPMTVLEIVAHVGLADPA